MIGATGMNTALQIALAFLRAETSADYQWAMEVLKEMLVGMGTSPVMVTDRELALVNTINSVFPETHLLLCRWHVNKNVLKTYKRHFTTNETWQEFDTAWQRVLNNVTEEAYEINLQNLQHQPEVCVCYCMETWLNPWKICIIRAWVDHLPHFEHTVTLQIEGCHGKIKQYLGIFRGNLKNFYDKLCLYWEAQKARYIFGLAQAMIRPTHSTCTQQPLYGAVLSKVHPYALGKILEQ